MSAEIEITENDIDNAARNIGIDPETMSDNDRNITRVLIAGARKIIALSDTVNKIQVIDTEMAVIKQQECFEK